LLKTDICVVEQKPQEYDDGYNNEQQALLIGMKSRKKSNSMSEHDRWIAMYKILFPQDRFIPSPCRLSFKPSLTVLMKAQTTNQSLLLGEENYKDVVSSCEMSLSKGVPMHSKHPLISSLMLQIWLSLSKYFKRS
jgi:hypothetical protein